MTENKIPSGWELTKFMAISDINPKLPFEDIEDNLVVSFLPMKLVEEERNVIHLSETRKYLDVKKGFTSMTDGDVIFAKITPCMENGKIAVVHSLKNKIAFGSTEFHVFRCYKSVLNLYLFFFLVQSRTRQDAMPNMTGAVGQRRVPKKYLEELEIPLPPLPEQHRIVAKLEELFSELDKGIESLKTAQQQLKVYRQAVLKWAFEGRLTEGWRESKHGLFSAETLINLVKKDRIEYSISNKIKLNQKELDFSKAELLEFPELPSSWKWVKINCISEFDKHSIKAGPFGSSLKKEFYVESGYKIYGQEQVIAGDANIGNYFINQEKFKDLESCKVNPGDVLISLVGTIGKVFILPPNSKPGIINPRLVKISLNKQYYYPEFFKHYFESTYVKMIYKQKAHGATMDVLNLGIIQEIPFPLCSLDEQIQIISEIESRLSVCDKIEESIEDSLKQAEALRQSILKQAFEGKLVPQDPNDEPAPVLLERIKAEREQYLLPPKTRTPKAKKEKIATV